MMKILVINGPNMNMLGIREPNTYGYGTYDELVAYVEREGAKLQISVKCYQSNHEGDLVDCIQEALGKFDGIVINPAAYTHTSIAILDALRAVNIPTVEVHLSDISNRESYRSHSFVKETCVCSIVGKGFEGYKVAIQFLKDNY